MAGNEVASYGLSFWIVRLSVAIIAIASLLHFQWNQNIVDTQNQDYESIQIRPQHFLIAKNASSPLRIVSQKLHIKEALEIKIDDLRAKQLVFVMLNGANEGLLIEGHVNDMYAIARLGALALGANPQWVELGVRIFSMDGIEILNLQQIDLLRRVHILLEFQIWVWPGIEIGHIQNVIVSNKTIQMKTVSLTPKIFTVSNFFDQDEVDSILTQGTPYLDASLVDLNGKEGRSPQRTSMTAFLPPSNLTRTFQKRAATFARLPSPSYAERLHLVRYLAGQLYRPHYDTFDGKPLLHPKELSGDSYQLYTEWLDWAIIKLEYLEGIPEEFMRGNKLHPSSPDFPNTILKLFYNWACNTNFFKARHDEAWQEWIQSNLEDNEVNFLQDLLQTDAKPNYLPYIIQVWQNTLARHELTYFITPKKEFSGLAHYFRWIRWLKELNVNCTTSCSNEPPSSEWYPQFDNIFQHKLLDLLISLTPREKLYTLTNTSFSQWFLDRYERGYRGDLLLNAINDFGETLLPHLIQLYESQINDILYQMPQNIPPNIYTPQRFATIFLYLNDVESGGSTEFPLVSQSISVKAKALEAAFFYVQTPIHEIDFLALHSGNPPNNVKWGANAFLWNSDAEEGMALWLR
ncbi:hypothetical protein THRCLA_10150 [Thraustotheca clavata]|uniref:Prolyl 4-hydroxylase alpha subunit domain-containing protein n=1 Tax=Thraustotheca clavata TaxID=74557 RepID=A0A1V9YS99_9STRA|nr:hypothetical protein THRCLA_10150 [Thraustotheca clavata]